MAFADSKRFTIEQALAEVEAVRDEALAKAKSLKFERKRLAQSIADSADKMLSLVFFEKKALHVELAVLTGKLVESKKALTQKWRQRATAQQALIEKKMLWAKGSEKVGAVVASARE